jgi:ubiquinone/menaquinone biosynthesis C-methylase UbiE/diadenosine tetraphosphate (Ap4A) HIT family hydrolase
MIYLLTTNIAKYQQLLPVIKDVKIQLIEHSFTLKEIQSDDPIEVLRDKAQQAYNFFGRNCIVDDFQLELCDYPNYPGAMTKTALKTLGPEGFAKLLDKTEKMGYMHCYIGGIIDGEFHYWQGTSKGYLDFTKEVKCKSTPLASWFSALEPMPEFLGYEHRVKALQLVKGDLCKVKQDIKVKTCNFDMSCVFCAELSNQPNNLYLQLTQGKLPNSRIVWETDHFVVMPPLGEFIEGGLLIIAKRHISSMALLQDAEFSELEFLMHEIKQAILDIYDSESIYFEHGPSIYGKKGACCVDHAHINVFPFNHSIADDLRNIPKTKINSLSEIKEASIDDDYLFVQYPSGQKELLFPKNIPSQFIRKIITNILHMPERGDWKNYHGIQEMKHTIDAFNAYLQQKENAQKTNYLNGDINGIASSWNSKAKYWDSMLKSDSCHLNTDDAYQQFLTTSKCIVQTIKETTASNNLSLLDLGCGTGLVSEYLYEDFGSIVGVDISKEMLNEARNKNIPNSNFYLQDCLCTNFTDNSFDVVASRGILLSHYNIDLAQKILHEIFRILKNDGCLIIDFLNMEAREHFEIVNKQYYQCDEIKQLGETAKFSKIEFIGDIAKNRVLLAKMEK